MGDAYLQVVKPLPERGKWFGFFCHMLHITFNKNTQCQVAFPSALCLLALQSHKGLFLPGMRSEFGSLLKDDDVVLLCSEEYLLLQSSINHKYQHNGSAYWAKGHLSLCIQEFLKIQQRYTFLLLTFLLKTRQRAEENGSTATVSSAGDSSTSSLFAKISLEPVLFLFWTRLLAEKTPEGVCMINTVSGFGALQRKQNS